MPENIGYSDKSDKSDKKDKKVNWREVHKRELVDFVREFYQTSFDWRKKAYHEKWDKWERNYRNIYDPTIKAKKKPWQATMFIPATVTNCEVITSALTKISSGKKRTIALEPREMGDELQAELNTALMDYYLEKGDYAINRYDTQKEAVIFGSGFMKLFWEKKWAKRRMIEPVLAGFTDSIKAVNEFKVVRPGEKIGDKEVVKELLIKNGVRYQHIHIRNIFLDPNSTDRQRFIHRERVTYGELKSMADKKQVDSESVNTLWGIFEGDQFEEDVRPLKYEQLHDDPKIPAPSYGKKHTIWEYWGILPRKWIDLDMPEDNEKQKEKAEELTPGRALVASGHYFLASEENKNQSMEPPLLQIDYIRSGQTYGIGVGQLMEGLQEELNEIRNQRVDNVSLLMNKVFIAIEKYIVDPNEVESKPGGIIRLKGSEIDDVRKVFSQLEISDVPISAFRETLELERQIQEVTAANRMTIGTGGQTRDTNQTLGGMELLRQAAFDRFTVYAFIIGRQFDVKVAKKSMELIYQNIDENAVRFILGEQPVEVLPGEIFQKWRLWERISPDEIDICYNYVPVDIFAMENKFQKSQDLMSYGQFLASTLPSWNPVPLAKKLGSLKEFNAEEVTEILGDLNGPIQTPLGLGQGVPSISKATKQSTGEVSPPSGSAVGGL